jgi:alkanesulfonate monooxygenase SsuD/methylene tetrahydromethanopterin reductase-like flavin-dependent oxidoreductase (luciferase family)
MEVPMEFGWKVPEFPADGSDNAAMIRQTFATLDLVADRFDAAWVTDHVLPWARWQAVETSVTECWTTLTFLASRYPNLPWGTIVLCQSYRNPALLAKMVANLCAFIPGKVIFGIGAGWKDDEYRAYNWEFPKPSVRIRQLEEAVEIAKRLWTADNVTYEGQYYSVHDAYLNPKPDPLPPIMIGGGGEQLTLRVVAKHADWWNGGGTRETYAHKLDVLRGHCAAVGRDFGTIKKTWQCECVAVARTQEDAERMAAASPFYAAPESALVGTPEQVVAQIRQWAALGVSQMQIRFADFPKTDGIRLFMDEVMPQFAP